MIRNGRIKTQFDGVDSVSMSVKRETIEFAVFRAVLAGLQIKGAWVWFTLYIRYVQQVLVPIARCDTPFHFQRE